jgi:hypothetical protein
MATMTYDVGATNATTAEKAAKDAVKRKGVFARLIAAMQESRRRQAEIEIRRVRALVGDNDTSYQHALLPFRGE